MVNRAIVPTSTNKDSGVIPDSVGHIPLERVSDSGVKEDRTIKTPPNEIGSTAILDTEPVVRKSLADVHSSTTDINDALSCGYTLPALSYNRSLRPYLTGDAKHVAVGIEGIIRDAIRQSAVQVSRVEVTLRKFQGQRRPELKFTVHTPMNAEQAMALWDTIGFLVESWRRRLSPRRLRVLDEQTAISVEWVSK